jgi:hypothetical protein
MKNLTKNLLLVSLLGWGLATAALAAPNKIVTLGPVTLSSTLTTNIFSPPTTTGGTGVPEQTTNTFYIIRHCRIVNKTGSAATFSLYKGASAGNVAGTEIIGTALSVAANSAFDWYGLLRLDSGDTNKFIVGGSGTATALVIDCEAEMGIS